MVPGHAVPHNWSPIDWAVLDKRSPTYSVLMDKWSTGTEFHGDPLSRGTGSGGPEVQASSGFGTKCVVAVSNGIVIACLGLLTLIRIIKPVIKYDMTAPPERKSTYYILNME